MTRLTDIQKEDLLACVKEAIQAPEESDIGPVLQGPSTELPGIWVIVGTEWAYLGRSYESAKLTADLSDWWVATRDGAMLLDDVSWFETRAMLGDVWESFELPMFKQERRARLALNIQLAAGNE